MIFFNYTYTFFSRLLKKHIKLKHFKPRVLLEIYFFKKVSFLFEHVLKHSKALSYSPVERNHTSN
jgi:hypothetical protein